MSDLVGRLKAIDYQMLGSTKTSPKRTIYFEAASFIEQQQQRIAELEAQLSQLHEQQDSKAITMLFGLMGYLTSMEEPITFSAYHNATPGADILSRLIQANKLIGDCDWDSYKPPKEKDDD